MLQVGPHVRPRADHGAGGNPYAPFIFQVNTENLGGTGSPTKTFRAPNLQRGRQLIDWGDGTVNYEVEHEYAVGGAYTITIDAIVTDWSFINAGLYDAEKITNVSQCESLSLNLGNFGTFDGCKNMTWTATDAPHFINQLVITFRSCEKLNADIDHWDVSQCLSMFGTFAGAILYNQGMPSWSTGNVTDMTAMFSGSTAFNQFLPWNTSNVTSMANMFGTATSFNSGVDQFDVSKVENFADMFRSAPNFNQPKPSWNTGSATNMSGMYAGTVFNHPINHFITNSVTTFGEMFDTTPSFNQDISSWNVESANDMTRMLSGSGLSTANYNAFLISCDGQNVLSDVTLGAQGLVHSGAGTTARTSLINNDNWDIIGDSL